MKLLIGSLLIFIGLTNSSCTDYYFSSPQPVDAKNLYKAPKKLTGEWLISQSSNMDENEEERLIVTKNYYKHISKSKNKESKNTMALDSNIYFINDKIYAKEDGILVGGFDYIIDGDSVITELVNIQLVDFGQNVFLRKFDYGYILNLKHEKMNDWWNIKFVDTRNSEGIIVRELKAEDLKEDKNHEVLHEDHKHYINANWSKSDIEDLINMGGFSDTLFFLRYDEKIKH